jgi:hypothetical protein
MTAKNPFTVERTIVFRERIWTGLSAPKTQKAGRQKVGNRFKSFACGQRISYRIKNHCSISLIGLFCRVRHRAFSFYSGFITQGGLPMHSIAHWSFKVVDHAKALPVGIKYFKAAEECLGARLLSHHDSGRELRACVCVACAGDAIQKLAVDYNKNRLLNQGAPRSKDVQNEIDAVLSASEALLKALLSMNDYTRKAFAPHASGLDLPDYLGRFDEEGDPPEYDSYSDFDSELVKNLMAVRDVAAVVSAKHKETNEKTVDRGGNTNRFKEEHGSPDSNLVKSGWVVFETFQPGKASGNTTNGAFHEFLGHVYGYATGKNPENYSGLAVWIKTLAVLLRQRQDCLGEEIGLEREMNAFEATDLGQASVASELRDRRNVIRKKLERIELAIQMVRPGKKPALI